ncbi:MAG TPA: DegV family protein [Syntrophomonadaceae bacterium]|nr:DegV family protein [Syntrophomonadaceae bacterium]
MKKIALVTDSTADLTEEVQKKYDIHVIPLKIRFGNSEYFDHEITSEEFYRRLAEEEELPQTSQPTPDEFDCLYRKLLKEYNEIISIHISSGLSGTLNSAHLAKEKLKAKIHIIDSKNISLGMGLMVLEASRNIREGLDARHIVEKITNVRKNIETLFTLNTLEYLQKGGRIGKVHSLLGSLLNVKPVVRVGDDGIYHTYTKARGQRKALKAIVKAFQELARGRKRIQLAVAHGDAFPAGQYLREALENASDLKTAIFTQVGPVIGVHTGPGTVGAAIQYK